MVNELKGKVHQTVRRGRTFVRETPNKFLILGSIGAVVVGVIVYQFFYPTTTLLPGTSIDGIALSSVKKDDAIKQLDEAYGKAKVSIYFDDSKQERAAPSLPDLGIKVKNDLRIHNLDYPWYMRLVPSSVWWYGNVYSPTEPVAMRDEVTLSAFMKKQFGEACEVQPVNATITQKEGAFLVVDDVIGGTCDANEVKTALSNVEAVLKPKPVTVHGTTVPAVINREAAAKELSRLEGVLAGDVSLTVLGEGVKVSGKTFAPWVTYDASGEALVLGLSEGVDEWLTAQYGKKLEVAPGVSRVTTHDFTETSRVNGASGRALDVALTKTNIAKQLVGSVSVSVVAPRAVAPTVHYTRSYSSTDEGLSALIKNYAESNPGTFGVSLVELNGQKHRAEYNATKTFTTASTYKLFIGYSVLLRIERGEWQWSDQISGGRDVSRCFDDMIKLSDNPCSEEFLKKIGYRNATNEAKAIGATQTSFLGSDGIKSTARDESTFLGALYSGQMLSQQASRDRFMSALHGNIYRRGIPAGIPSASVANKVGFMNALLHDAAIVNAPTGTYVLVILTEGSSWASIAELTKQIEALRGQ